MDNKITKKRLANFLSYEWIIMLVAVVAGILLWEFIFTVSGVRLTAGQNFKIYYDKKISSNSDIYSLITKDNKTFSYDVIEINIEDVTDDQVLMARYSVQEGDIIITDCVQENEEDKVRAKTLIDGYDIYDLDKLLSDAEDYLSRFYNDGVLDQEKVKSNFLKRMQKDNRFRTEKEKQKGIEQEIQRIEKLNKDVSDFKTVLETFSEEDFFWYSKYAQSGKEEGLEEPKRYGLKVENLNGGQYNPSEFFTLSNREDSKDIVILVFNFKSYQKDLQYETVSFLMTVIRACCGEIA